MSATPAETAALAALTIVTRSLVDQRHWSFFDFSSRPMTGRLFRMFRGRRRIARERALARELPAVALAEIGRWFMSLAGASPDPSFIARVLELSVDGYGEPLWPAYEFENRNEAAWYFAEALKAYLPISDEERAHIFARRTVPSIAQPDVPIWLLGATKLFHSSESIITHIPSYMLETTRPHTDFRDVRVNDHRYSQVVSALMSCV